MLRVKIKRASFHSRYIFQQAVGVNVEMSVLTELAVRCVSWMLRRPLKAARTSGAAAAAAVIMGFYERESEHHCVFFSTLISRQIIAHIIEHLLRCSCAIAAV